MSNNGNGKIKPEMTFWERLYFPEILHGMSITMKALFRPKFTRQYPEERWVPPPVFRGRPVLVVEDETGVERCVACGLCARVCPSLAIQVQAAETELDKERYPVLFEINMLRCIFCGFCEEVCPEEAIIMSKEFELTFADPKDAVFGKDRLLTPRSKLEDRLEFLKQYR